MLMVDTAPPTDLDGGIPAVDRARGHVAMDAGLRRDLRAVADGQGAPLAPAWPPIITW